MPDSEVHRTAVQLVIAGLQLVILVIAHGGEVAAT